MVKRLAGGLTALAALLLFCARLLQLFFEYDPASDLFESGIFGYGVTALCFLVTAIFIIIWRQSRDRAEVFTKTPTTSVRLGSVVLLITSAISTAVQWFLVLGGGGEGNRIEATSLANAVFTGAFVLFAMYMVVFLKTGKNRGEVVFTMIPVVAFLYYLTFHFVSVTEMAQPFHYCLHILAACTLTIFFFSYAKRRLYGRSQMATGGWGLLSCVYLTAECLAGPVYRVITGGFDLLNWAGFGLIGIGLAVFTFTFGAYLVEN